jgi:recombination protein RecT
MAENEKELAVKNQTSHSERFTQMVIKEYKTNVGLVEFDEYKKRLTQNLFISADCALKEMEAKRIKDGKKIMPFVWHNINMEKAAIDAVRRIDLGLDALVPNHIHTVPYYNSKLNKYDLNFMLGYAGKDYMYRTKALNDPKMIYELVHKNDQFRVIKRSFKNDVESYEFKIIKPFDRGDVIGGFGYIEYADKSQNTLVLVSGEVLKDAEKRAQSKRFWERDKEAMQYKTVVHRTMKKIVLDPRKINTSFLQVNNDDNEPPKSISFDEMEGDQNENNQPIDIEPESVETVQKPEPEAGPGF